MARSKQSFTKIKEANLPLVFKNNDELQEFVNCTKDPIYFMENFIFIQHPTKGKMPFIPYEYQRELINIYWKNLNVIAMVPRQSGKTISAAIFLLWYAMFTPDSTILIASNKFKSASEIMSRIKFAYEELPDHIRAGVSSYNVQSIEFDNGSRIMATTTTPDSGRGMSISVLYCLDGDTTIKIRNKFTLVEEEVTLEELYIRLSNPKQVIR